jgi:hypothetical protein
MNGNLIGPLQFFCRAVHRDLTRNKVARRRPGDPRKLTK